MDDANTTAGLSPPPGPKKHRPSKPIPPAINDLLIVVRVLLEYGRHLQDTLEIRARQRNFSVLAVCFGTARLPTILGRIARGIRHAIALERVLLARAARGRDLVFFKPRKRKPKPPQPQAAQEAAGAKPPRPPRRGQRPEMSELPDPLNFPTIEDFEAEIRRRSIGEALADICRDLGIEFGLCDTVLGNALFDMINGYRGNFGRYFKEMRRREVKYSDEWDQDRTRAYDWPSAKRDFIRSALGFLIGVALPVCPYLPSEPAGLVPAAATGPP